MTASLGNTSGGKPSRVSSSLAHYINLAKWIIDQFLKTISQCETFAIGTSPIDIMMAAVSLAVDNWTLITVDTDFDSVPGITVEKWTV